MADNVKCLDVLAKMRNTHTWFKLFCSLILLRVIILSNVKFKHEIQVTCIQIAIYNYCPPTKFQIWLPQAAAAKFTVQWPSKNYIKPWNHMNILWVVCNILSHHCFLKYSTKWGKILFWFCHIYHHLCKKEVFFVTYGTHSSNSDKIEKVCWITRFDLKE